MNDETFTHLTDLRDVLPYPSYFRLACVYDIAQIKGNLRHIARLIDRIHTKVFAPDLYEAQR